jgi:hypothetical protein
VQFCKLSPKTTDLGIWSNWSLNPVFPVYANELVGYLSSSRRHTQQHEVGDDLQFELAETDYQPEVRVRRPHTQERQEITLTPEAESGKYLVDAGRGDVSGVWELELSPRDGKPEQRLMAVNVPGNAEGDLHHLDREGLGRRLQGIDYEFSLASRLTASDDQLAGFRLSDTLLYVLIATLIAEQWLAYRASYHNAAKNNA